MTVRAVRTPLALVLDVIWGYALAAIVVAAISGGDQAGPSLAAVAAVVLGSWGVARGLRELDLDESASRRAGVAISVIAVFAVLRLEYGGSSAPWDFGWLRALVTETATAIDAHRGVVAASAVMVALWLRGTSRGQQTLEYEDVLGTSTLGFVAVVIAAVVAPDTRGPELFGPLALVYLVVALGVLALFQAPEPDAPVVRFVSRWAAGVGMLLGVAAVLAVIAAAVDPASLGVLEPVARPLSVALDAIGRYIIGPLLAGPVWLLQHLLPSLDQPAPQQSQQQPDQPPVHHDTTRPMWQQVLGWIFAGGLLAALVAVLLVLLWFAYRRFSRRKPRPFEVREQVERDVALRDDLRALWDDFARRFRRTPSRSAATIDVQRLYHEILADAATHGLERPASATPLQFAPPLDAHYGSGVPGEVSAAFTASRYGQLHPDRGAFDELRASWQDARKRRDSSQTWRP